jgi:hypothetical protein
VVQVNDVRVEVFAASETRLTPISTIVLPQIAGAVDVSAKVPWIVGRDAQHEECWAWRPETGYTVIGRREGTSELVVAGFIEAPDQTLLAVAKGPELQIFDGVGRLVNVLEVGRPHAWRCHRFTAISNTHVSITGNLFSDPSDMIITVTLADLLSVRSAVQTALENGCAIHDRAMKLVVGRGPAGTAVVIRDPEDEEPADDNDELPDTWGLRGYYMRQLSSGVLSERAAYDGAFSKDATLVATDRSIAIEVPGGVDIIERPGVGLRTVRDGVAAVDPVGARIGSLDRGGRWTVEQLR